MYFLHKFATFLLSALLNLIFLSNFPRISGDLSQCTPCNERDCQVDLNCQGQMILDPCGCCIECAKELGESCGEMDGEYYGQCGQGLICSNNWRTDEPRQPGVCIRELDDVGESSFADSLQYSSDLCEASYSGCNNDGGVCVCAVNLTVALCESPFEFQSPEDCQESLQASPQSHATDPPADRCADVYCQIYECPRDSTLLQTPVEPGECCPQAPSCECDFSKCSVILCASGYERKTKVSGLGEPGRCCDVHECVEIDDPPADSCDQVICQEYDVSCPGDSTISQTPLQPGECCPPPPTCECNLSLCSVILCTSGYNRRIKVTGTGEPGACCDVYECVKETVADCSGVVCNTGPQRICPEGTRTIMGGLSEDGCCLLPSRCDCDPDQCIIPSCLEGYSPRRSREARGVPGDCCDEFECVSGSIVPGCNSSDVTYSEGERWKIDECKDCECRQGMSHCSVRQACYYQLCFVDGVLQEPGYRWHVDDCTTCECRNGMAACTTASCRLDCLHPRKVPGICCPVCDDAVTTSQPLVSSTVLSVCQEKDCSHLSCENGFALDTFGCRTCQCLDVQCPGTEMCPPCASGYRVDENGCETCRCVKCPSMESCHKFCPYGYQRGRNNCIRCRCEKCPPLERCSKQCVHGRETNDRGCQICKCKNSTTSPSRPTSSHSCKTHSGRTYSDGEGWHDGCRECFCHDGHEMCALISCPAPKCDQPVIKPNLCCPVCPGAVPTFVPLLEPKLQVCHSLEGAFYVEGETWSIDSCTSCVCHNGHVLCSIQECPPAPCLSPVKSDGQCCGTCPEVNSGVSEFDSLIPCVLPTNHFFPSGASWKEDDCSSCQCINGEISCYNQTCPPTSCEKPILRKGQCCSSCIETPPVSVCEYADEVYMDGDSWYASTCVTCACYQGSIFCSEAECPPLDCERRTLLEGACCPSCIEKDYKGTTSLGSDVTSKPHTSNSRPERPKITPWIPNPEEGEKSTKGGPTLENLPPAAVDGGKGSPILLITCIILSCVVVLLLLIVLVKRKHRLLYNVNQKQMPIKRPEDTAVTIMSIKPKNTDVAKQSNHEPVRDSIRDSKIFKENLANKINNVNSKMDSYEIKYSDKFAGNKIDHV